MHRTYFLMSYSEIPGQNQLEYQMSGLYLYEEVMGFQKPKTFQNANCKSWVPKNGGGTLFEDATTVLLDSGIYFAFVQKNPRGAGVHLG